MGICDGRVVIITGAARGLGREYALGFAAEGAHVVVNDLGGATDREAAAALVAEIKAAGGNAITNHDDIAEWDGAGRLIRAALDAFGALHVVVNNAGILRLFPFEEEPLENWDRTIRVHLRGHFCVARRALDYWRAEHIPAGRSPRASSTYRAARACRVPPVRRPTRRRRAALLRSLSRRLPSSAAMELPRMPGTHRSHAYDVGVLARSNSQA